jgi:hypothetical protein
MSCLESINGIQEKWVILSIISPVNPPIENATTDWCGSLSLFTIHLFIKSTFDPLSIKI